MGDQRGNLHMVVHQGLNRGMSVHSEDGVNWVYTQSFEAYSPRLNFTDGTSLIVANRQEAKVIIDEETGLPSYLINICGIKGIKHTLCVSNRFVLGAPRFFDRRVYARLCLREHSIVECISSRIVVRTRGS